MIIEYEEKLLGLIDERVSTASDDELFAGGYLRGHISLSAAACEEEGLVNVADLTARVDASLAAARTELSPADRIVVNDLWQELTSHI